MRLLRLAAALLALSPFAAAQPDQGQGQEGESSEAEEQPRQVTLEDARQSIGTLVESFVGQNSPEGSMILRDKTTKKVRQLKLVSVDEKKVKASGDARYSVPAQMRDLATGQTLQAVFTADFGSPQWKVVGMRLMQPVAAKPRAQPAKSSELRKKGG